MKHIIICVLNIICSIPIKIIIFTPNNSIVDINTLNYNKNHNIKNKDNTIFNINIFNCNNKKIIIPQILLFLVVMLSMIIKIIIFCTINNNIFYINILNYDKKKY